MSGHNFEMKFNMFEAESLTGNPAFPADLKSGLTKSADVLLLPDCSWNKPLSRLAFRKKNQNDPNFWTTFGVLSLRQNLRMFSFHRIAAVEIKPLSRVCITQAAQNVLAHLIMRTCFSLRAKLGKVPILCINAMYSAHFSEHWYFVRCA